MTTLTERIEAKQKELKSAHTEKTGDKPQVMLQSLSLQAPENEIETQQVEDINSEAVANNSSASQRRPTYREGKRNIAAYHPEPVHRQFKVLAAEKGVTVQELHREALNLLFAKNDKPTIA